MWRLSLLAVTGAAMLLSACGSEKSGTVAEEPSSSDDTPFVVTADG